MPFLIDGYNLLHAIGLLGGRAGPRGLAKARAALLNLLASAHADDAGEVTVVFDAQRAPTRSDGDEIHDGLHVHFTHGETADDRIEWLIAHDAAPKRLVVVSDDHRVQQAARRRGCPAWACGDYLDWIDRRHRERSPPRPAEPDKPEAVSPAETERWQSVFGALQDDPEFRELFDTFGADEIDDDRAGGG